MIARDPDIAEDWVKVKTKTPITGMALLFGSGEDWDISKRAEWESPWEFADDDVLLVGHIASHLLFYAALALHVGLVLKHTVIKRDGQLWRML